MYPIFGVQFFYIQILKNRAIIKSIFRKANYLNSSLIETVFGISKLKLLYYYIQGGLFLQNLLTNYIYHYNTKRIKLKFKGISSI